MDMEFEIIEVSAFEAEVKAEAAHLIETAQLITGNLETAVEAAVQAITWAMEHLSETEPSDYRSRLRRQAIKTAIGLVCCGGAGEVVSKADYVAQSCSSGLGKGPNSALRPDSSVEVSDTAGDLLQNLSHLPRIAFVLRHVLGCSNAESSFMLGLDQPAFVSNLRRAYLELGAGACLKSPQVALILTQGNWTSASAV